MLALLLAVAVSVAPDRAAAQGGGRSGKDVVDTLCVSCHGTGASGAPRIGDSKAWARRASQGLTGLTQNALKGIRQMPAHGGNPNLTDGEIERAITYMVNQSGGRWAEPLNRASPGAARSGEQVVRATCARCHEAGVGGAPRIGDQAAWLPRLKLGLDTLILSAINGHGGMPPRGGAADLTDPEMRSAIVYMFNAGAVAAKAAPAAKAAAGQAYRVVDGTTIYFGVVPADTIRRSPKDYPAKRIRRRADEPPAVLRDRRAVRRQHRPANHRRDAEGACRDGDRRRTREGAGADDGRRVTDLRGLFRDGGRRTLHGQRADQETRRRGGDSGAVRVHAP